MRSLTSRDDSEDEALSDKRKHKASGLKARAAALLNIRDGEWRPVTLVMALMFVPSAGTAIGVASAESLFLSRVGADALPVLYIALGLVTIVATLGTTALLGRIAPLRLYLLMPIALVLLLATARILVELDVDGIYRSLWVTVFVIDTFTRLSLWGIAGITFDTRQAKRLYPLLVAAGILGLAVGGFVTGPLVEELGTENLLLVWALMLLAGLALGRTIAQTNDAGSRASVRAKRRRRRVRVRDELQSGFRYVRRSPLMRWIAVSAVLFQALFFLLAFPFSKAVEAAHPVEDEMTAFLGIYRGVVTGSALLVSLLIATRFNARYGLMAGLLALAVFDLIGFSALSVSAPFLGIVAFRYFHEIWQSGIVRTAWFALFNIVPSLRREQTRMFVDGICVQFGVMLVGVTLLIGTEVMAAHELFLIGTVAAGFTLLVIIRARGVYLSALVQALRAGRPQVFSNEEDPFSSFQQDASALSVAMAGLSDPDPAVRRVSADVLGNLSVAAVVPALKDALSDGDADVRASVLPALARLGAGSAWESVVTCLSDPEARVRVEALATLRKLAQDGGGFDAHAERMLNDPVASVRALAAASLLSNGAHDGARQTLRDMCAAEAVESRICALESYAEWGDASAFEPVEATLVDPRPAVRRAAASALSRIDHPRRADTLAKALGDDDRSVREAAAGSMGAIGLAILESVVDSLEDPALEDGALLALEHLPVASQAQAIRTYAGSRVTKALHYHGLWQQARLLARSNDHARLLADALRYHSEQHGLNALRAIGTVGDTGAIDVAVDSLKSADPAQRANAVEALDSISDRDIVRPVLRLWEPVGESAHALEGTSPVQALLQSLRDANAWLRACAVLAADGSEEPEIRSEIRRLAQSDPDPMVRETAASALHGDKPMQTLDTLSLMERILFMKGVPLFAKLPPAEVKQVAAIADEHLFVDGEVIARQNEPGDELYVIVSGNVRVMVTDDGRETEIAIRGSGEYVGEMAIISQKPRMAKLVAVGDVRVLCIGQKSFEGILRERPITSLAVMRELCDRLRERESAAH